MSVRKGNDSHEKIETKGKKFKTDFTTILLFAAGFGAVVFAVLLSASHVPVFKSILEFIHVGEEELQKLIYICIGLIAIALATERMIDLGKIKKNIEKQTEEIGRMETAVSNLGLDHQSFARSFEKLLSMTEINFLRDSSALTEGVKALINPNLFYLFKDEIAERTGYLSEAIKEGKVSFNDISIFRLVYANWLNHKPGNIIYTTSSANRNYFWSGKGDTNKKIEDAIKRFTSSGGKMHRIFYMTNEEWDSPQALDILNKQIELGVTVYRMRVKDKQPDLKYFVVDCNELITFRIYINENTKEMTNFACKADKTYASDYIRLWEKQQDNDNTELYIPATAVQNN